MDSRTFLFAVLALLITPGPTNTLLALGGAAQGPRTALRLLPAELVGYLAVVVPLALARMWIDPNVGLLGTGIRIAAALWVAVLAFRIGFSSLPAQGALRAVSARDVLVTTLLNPKVLIFALILLPAPAEADFALRLGLFALCVPVVGAGWTLAGAFLHRQGGARAADWFRRAAAVWLAVLAVMLAQTALAG